MASVDAGLLRLLEQHLQVRGQPDVAGGAVVRRDGHLQLAVADARRDDDAADGVRPLLEHRGGGRQVVAEAVEDDVAGRKADGAHRALPAVVAGAFALGLVDRPGRGEQALEPLDRHGEQAPERRVGGLELRQVGLAQDREARQVGGGAQVRRARARRPRAAARNPAPPARRRPSGRARRRSARAAAPRPGGTLCRSGLRHCLSPRLIGQTRTGRRGGAEGRSPSAERSEHDGGPQRQDPAACTVTKASACAAGSA